MPEPMHSLLTDKQDKTGAVNKHEERKHAQVENIDFMYFIDY